MFYIPIAVWPIRCRYIAKHGIKSVYQALASHFFKSWQYAPCMILKVIHTEGWFGMASKTRAMCKCQAHT